MKNPIKLAMIGALGLLTSTVTFAQTAPGEDSSSQSPPRGRPGSERPGPEAHRKVLLEKYDANKDGKLDDTELTALGRDVFEGKLPPPGRGPGGPDERGGPGFRPQGRGGADGPGFGPAGQGGPQREGERNFRPRGRHDADGPRPPHGQMADRRDFGRDRGADRRSFGPGPRGFGRPDSEEGRKMLEEHRREFLKKYDTNGDGKLDPAEREAIGKDIEDGKLPPPPMPPRRGPELPKEQ